MPSRSSGSRPGRPAPRGRSPRRRRPALPAPITQRESRRRIRILGVCMIVGVGAIVARAGYLGFVQGGDLSAIASDQRVRTVDLPAQRGSILDASGIELAADRPTARVEASPYLITDPQGVARKLAPLLRKDPGELATTLGAGTRWALVARRVDQKTARRIRDLDLTGIDLIDTSGRVEPLGTAGAQTLGLVGDDGHGQSGLERLYDAKLRGTAGVRVEARDPRQETLKVLRDVEPHPGVDVTTTIDAVTQRRVQQILAGTVEKHQATSATAIVMRPDTGEIIAMATAPSFDPGNRSTFDAEKARDRAVAWSFEPGSTFKVVTIAGALESRRMTPSTSLFVPQWVWIDEKLDRKLYDAEKERPSQTMTVANVLKHSSNVGTVLIAQRLGARGINDWIARFGFGKGTGLGLAGEEKGAILPTERWSGASIYNIPIGQGNMVTQMQLTRAYAAIANRGRMPAPRLVSRVGADDVPAAASVPVMRPATAQALTAMLRGVVSAKGTGSEASIPGYAVAGKTGTANKVDPKTGEYSNRYTASFVGFVPAERPRLVISVVVDEPSAGAYYGGDVAAPAFEKIGQFCLNRLKIPPT